MTGILRVPRSRGALSGVIVMLLGLWGGFAALVGPYFDFAFAPDTAWSFTSGRVWLEIVPAGAVFVGGLILLVSANRAIAAFGAWLAAVGGAWFAVGVPLSALWPAGDRLGAPVGGTTRQVVEQVSLLYGLGVVTVFFAAVALGRLAVVGVKDARLAERAAKDPRDFAPPDKEKVAVAVAEIGEQELRQAYKITVKQQRYAAVDAVKAKVKAGLLPEGGEEKFSKEQVDEAFHDLQAKVVRWNILDDGLRIDGRDLKTVRPIVSEVGVLPRAHGSALFTRGETQALVVATLGTGEDEQFVDSLEGTYKERFLLHYNFPPYSVGETGRLGSPGRREIGHGKLAWRAIRPVLPAPAEFPYTLRVVSEITESNGSSSMATVCGSSLALMDAGVPLKRPTAGIAMGLILEGERFAILSDILGDEDHLGDMDFKVAGTQEGVTSLQMDIKIAGITEEIMSKALAQAREGRLHILGEMAKALATSRAELGEFAPRIETMKIATDKIRDVIGTGGKVIREIVEKTGAKINIEDDGTVKVASSDANSIKAAINWIKSIASDPEVGQIYEGTVVKTADFGAFVNFFGARDGLVHISQLSSSRVNKTTDVVKEGDKVKVKLLGFDDRGKVRLSMRAVDQATGEDLEAKAKAEAAAGAGA